MDATPEEWRPVVGFEGSYEVSDCGRVRSLDRVVTFRDGRSRLARGRVLKSWAQKRVGHHAVGLGRQRFLVHVLVLEAFVGSRPDGMVCCHRNGISGDNRVENLRWDTHTENNFDLVRHGTHFQAGKTHCPSGHEYSRENTRDYLYQGTWRRYCRACQNSAGKDYKRRQRAMVSPKKRVLRSHCKRGHEYTADNTYQRPDGKGRQCVKCNRLRANGVVISA